MPDKPIFNPEKLSIVEFRFLKGQVDGPEEFVLENIEMYNIQNKLELLFNLDEKLARADFTIDITTDSKGKNSKEATGNFHFFYLFKVENLEELAKLNDLKLVELDSSLGNSLASITYSTSRGVLLTRLQSTALQNFILPVINPNILLVPELTE